MRKNILAVFAAVCAVALTGCVGESKEADTTAAPPRETSVYTEAIERPAVTESTEAVSETEAIQADTEPAPQDEPPAEAVSCADIVNAVVSAVEMPSMAEVGYERLGMYLDLNIPEDCDFAMSICGSGGFADEVFVINTNSADISVSDVIASAESRIEYRKKDFEGYNPDEYDKLDNYITAEKNGYFMYAVTSDNAACESVFNDFVK